MNREIKFRVWDTKTKKFIDHIPNKEYMLDYDEWDHRDMDEMGGIYPQNIHETFGGRLIWSQYVGIKDQKGKDIYENDILSGHWLPVDLLGQVKYKDGSFIVCWIENGKVNESGFLLSSTSAHFDCLRIVGNIFEPELIK